MTPLRWNWVREHPWLTENRVASATSPARFHQPTPTGPFISSNGRFERALAPGCAEDCGEAFRPMRTRCLTRSYWALGRQLTDTRVEHRSLAPSRPWAGRGWRGAIGQQGWRRASEGRQSMSSAQMGLLFTRPPRLVRCSDFKDATKAAAETSTGRGSTLITGQFPVDKWHDVVASRD